MVEEMMQKRSKVLIGFAYAVLVSGCIQKSSENRRRPIEDVPKTTTPAPTPTGSVPDAKLMGIVEKSCSGGTCHGSGSNFGVYVGNPENVQKDSAKIYQAINADRMPITSTGKSLPKADKTYVLEKLKSGTADKSGEVKHTNEGTTTLDPNAANSGLTRECGVEPTKTLVANATTKATFAEVDAISQKSCVGSTCHQKGVTTGRKIFVGDEAGTKSQTNSIIDLIRRGRMPLGGSLTDAEKLAYYTFLCK